MSMVIRALALLLVLALPARAATYVLVCGPSSCTAPGGTTQPAGTALGRILWDGTTPYAPPPGERAVPDTGQAVYQPPAPHPATITSLAFFNRFTAAEQAAVQRAAASAPTTLGVGLTHGLIAGTINLAGCPSACRDPTIKAWMDGLVAAAAITAARETAILTP